MSVILIVGSRVRTIKHLLVKRSNHDSQSACVECSAMLEPEFDLACPVVQRPWHSRVFAAVNRIRQIVHARGRRENRRAPLEGDRSWLNLCTPMTAGAARYSPF